MSKAVTTSQWTWYLASAPLQGFVWERGSRLVETERGSGGGWSGARVEMLETEKSGASNRPKVVLNLLPLGIGQM